MNLSPCPFCGAPGELFHDTHSDYERHWDYRVQCSDHDNCWIEGPRHNEKDEAIRLWNRRARIDICLPDGEGYRMRGDRLKVQIDGNAGDLAIVDIWFLRADIEEVTIAAPHGWTYYRTVYGSVGSEGMLTGMVMVRYVLRLDRVVMGEVFTWIFSVPISHTYTLGYIQ